MKFIIKHETKGRMRIHLAQNHMTCRQADILQYYLEKVKNVSVLKCMNIPVTRRFILLALRRL